MSESDGSTYSSSEVTSSDVNSSDLNTIQRKIERIRAFNSESEPERLKEKDERDWFDQLQDRKLERFKLRRQWATFDDNPALKDFSDLMRNHAAYPLSYFDVVFLLRRHNCLDLTSQINSSQCPKLLPPIVNSTLGDVFSGQLRDGKLVAIRKICTNYDRAKQARMYDKQVAREIHAWSKCDHPNVLKTNRVAEFHEHLAIITLWEANGNLLQYLSCHPSTNPYQLSTSISGGLAYLHNCNIIHGNLKGTNVLISQDDTPMLMDFGMASLRDLIPQTSPRPKYSLRWTPLEIYEGKSSYTMSGDIYSLAMTILEAFTSRVPFADLTDNLLVPHVAVSRNIPTRPETIATNSADGDRLWAILTKCWSYNPKNRPSAEAVRSEIDPERPKSMAPAGRPSTEEVRSEVETIQPKGPDPKEHLSTKVDQGKMETLKIDNMGGPSTEAVPDDMQITTTANLDAVDRLNTGEVRSAVEAKRPEHRNNSLSRWRKWFNW